MILLLIVPLLAGCTTNEPAEAGFQVRIAAIEGPVYTGDEVVFRVQATATPEQVSWDFGDGHTGAGPSALHTYLDAGEFEVRVRALFEGQVAEATVDVLVDSFFGDFAPVMPLPQGNSTEAVYVWLPEGEPTVGGSAVMELAAWPGMQGAGDIDVFTDNGTLTFSFDAIPARFEVPVQVAGRQAWLWGADIGNASFTGTVHFDVWGEPIDFGAPSDDRWLRPGAQTVLSGSQCTVNFLFHYKWYRFFVGSAAHCVDPTDLNDVCSQGSGAKLGAQPTVSSHNGRSVKTTLAYSSWLTMDALGGGVCPANDFALYELGSEAQKVMHPAGLGFGGPTKLAPMDGYGTGTTLYGYGASQLHGNVGVGYPGQDDVNSKRGTSLGTSNSGFYQDMYFAIPGVPGDSGGPAYGPGGEALGAASVIYYAPFAGSNSYTILPKALEYMEAKEGWAPELVTHDAWQTT